jgi:hypothetical protein
MSEACSAGSADSTLASNGPVCELCGSASRTSSADVSLPGIGPESRVTPTCAPLWPTPVAHDDGKTDDAHMAMKARMPGGPRKTPTSLTVVVKATETGRYCPCKCHQSTSSAAGSPARTSASPAEERGSTGHARVFGASTRVSLASYDPGTSSWRTSQLSLLEDSGELLGTWPRSGMTRSGTAFLLRPLAPLTDVTGSGLWPTPMAQNGEERNSKTWLRPLGEPQNLENAVARWPTPNAADGRGGRKTPDEDLLTGKRSSGAKVQVSLRDAVRRDELRAWPTPTARLGQARGAQPKRYLNPERSNDLDDAVALAETFKTPTSAPFSHGGSGGGLHKQVGAPSGGPLNPQWVAWLMGFPLDWTSLPPSGTRSSRKSRNGSAGASSNTKKDG